MCPRRWMILATVTALLAAGFAAADVVRMKDGREFVGVILEEKSRTITIDTKISNIRTTMTLHRREIRELEKGPLPEGFFDERPSPPAATRPERPVAPARERPAPAARPSREEARYLEIPIEGEFGKDIIPIGVANALEQAKRRGVEHVVFRINSNGGAVWAAEDIATIMAEHEDAFTYHAVMDKAISASIWVALSCHTMHMTPGATMGAAVAYTRDTSTGELEVDAKFNSALAASLAARAERKGHSPELVRAMVIGAAEAYAWKDESGEWRIGAERPKQFQPDSLRTLDTGDTVLTLTAQEADELGFARLLESGETDDLREALGVERWRGLGRVGANEMERARNKAKPIFERFDVLLIEWRDAVARANAANPGAHNDYRVDYGGNLTDGSRRAWQQRTDAAIREWNRARAILVELEKLERQRAELNISRWVESVDLKTSFDLVTENVRRLEANRDRR